MAAILTIDRGNTLIKAKVFTDSGALLHELSMADPDMDRLARTVDDFGVTCGALCSVAHIDPRFAETLRMMLPDGLLWLTHETDVPLSVRYDTPRILGPDRVAAACGGAALHPGRTLLIADAGTALTLDVVEHGSVFAGGNISAGVNLRLKALHRYTSALPEVTAYGTLPPFGTDTVTALRCGAVRGAAAEVTDAYLRLKGRFPDTSLLLTGGDADLLLPLLPTETIRHADLVCEGLIYILKYNEYI